jgi:hypothetical protein
MKKKIVKMMFLPVSCVLIVVGWVCCVVVDRKLRAKPQGARKR